MVFSIFTDLGNNNHNQFSNCHCSQKKQGTLYPLAITYSFPPTPCHPFRSLGNHYSSTPWICFFWSFHIKGYYTVTAFFHLA